MSGLKKPILKTEANSFNNKHSEENLVLEYLIKGHSLRATETPSLALNYYEEALKYDPNNLEALTACGECFFDLGQFDDSYNSFQKALFIDAEDRYLWRCCSQSLALTTKYYDAVKFCQSLLTKWPDCGQTHFTLGKLYNRLNDVENAKKHYQEAIFLGFSNKEVCLEMGIMLLDNKQPKEAAEILLRAVREDINNPIPFFYLGKTFIKLADTKTALVNFKKYLELSDEDLLGANNYIQSCEQDVNTLPSVYIKELFDQYADNFDNSLINKLNYTVPFKILNKVKSLYQNKKIDILDLGCGTGLVGENIKDFARTLWGVDISPNMIEAAKSKKVYDKLFVGDILELELNKKFDLIIAGDVLVYFGELNPIFNVIKRFLKPNGIFIASTESDNNTALSNGFIFKESRRFGHNEKYIRDLLSSLDFKLSDFDNIIPRHEKGQPLKGYLFTAIKE